MCVAILAKPGHRVGNANLFAGWSVNSHGAGFAYVDPNTNKVVIQKGFLKSYNEFEKALSDAYDRAPDSPFLIHMRIRSVGHQNENNTHPFPIKGGALIHNGTLFTPTGSDVGPADDRKSDTRVFAERLYNVLEYPDVEAGKDDIGRAIGSYNKVVMLYDTKDYVIVNEANGEWVDDIWYSNSSCRLSRSYGGGSNVRNLNPNKV